MKLLFRKMGLLTLFAFSSAIGVFAQPCYSGFNYRLPVMLNNSLNAEIKNYQIQVVINSASLISASKMQSSGNDLRVLDRKGNPLAFWIEDGTINTSSTKLWIKTDSILGYKVDTLYLYYGNSTASSLSNKAATFDLYDDFSGASLGVGWTACGAGSSAVASGQLTLSSSSGTKRTVTSVASFAGPVLVEMGVSSTSSGGYSFMGSLNASNSGYALVQNANASIHKLNNTSCYTTTLVNTPSSVSSTAGTWTMVWSNVGAISGNLAGVATSSTDNSVSTSLNNKIVLGNIDGGSVSIDWIRARKYSANTISQTLGTEVSMAYSIAASYNAPICENSDLQLTVTNIPGASYKWTGPAGSGFTSTLREPLINGVDLNDAGQYLVDVTIPTGCASQSKTVNVSVTEASDGGSLSGSTTVCGGSNSGSLTLSGQVGNIVSWDTTSNLSGTWNNVTSTQNSRSYLDLAITTYYRVIVKNGVCAPDTSTIGVISVTSPSTGGNITGHDTVCQGSNSGILTLNNNVGNVERWERSTNGFLWSTIVNRSTIQAYTNLSQTTFYRAVVKNGLCNEAVSATQSIMVDATTVGGTVTGGAPACQGSNQGVLTLTGRVGNVIYWETSTTGTSPWTTVSNTADTFQYNNLIYNTFHRAIVKNGKCGLAASSSQEVVIIASSDGGSVSGTNTVCETANSGVLTLSGYTGTIDKWQYRSAVSSGWQDIAYTATTLPWSSLSDTTEYRALVSNQTCPADSSDIAVINVNKTSQSGYLSGTSAVCEGVNSGAVTLNSHYGDITKWESSSTGFSPWNTVANTTATQNFSNISSDIYYRAVVKSGLCSQVVTNAFYVKVNDKSEGGVTSGSASICAGSNYGLIGLNSHVGDVIYWQSSTDTNSGSWTDLANYTNRQDFRDLNITTFYRAVVKSGGCDADSSSITAIVVSQPTNAGIVSGDTSFCDSLNMGSIILANQLGDILRWEYSKTGSAPWVAIANTSSTLGYLNVNQTTFYRAIIKNGGCSQTESPVAMVGVYAKSTAGTLASDDTSACSNINYGSLTLSGYNGNIEKWEKSTDNGVTWQITGNTTDQQFYFNLKESTLYKASVKNSGCDAVVSNSLLINIDDPAFGGFVTPYSESCINLGTGVISLNDYVGNVTKWQTGPSASGPWTDTAVTADNIQFNNPANTIYYRAQVSGGVCGSVLSEPGELRIYKQSIAGTLVGGRNVCDSANSGVVSIVSNTGDAIRWEESSSSLGPWTSKLANGNSYNYFNLDKPLYLRVRVQNGICPDDVSNSIFFDILPNPVADFVTSDLCEGRISSFVNTSTISAGSVQDNLWAVNDGFSTSDKDFSKAFVAAGTFYVNLQVRSDSGCTDAITKQIIIQETPLANFRLGGELGDGIGCSADSLFFVNLTQAPSSGSNFYNWNFGDGTTSVLDVPTKKYDLPGTYNVKLTVGNSANCYDSLDRYVTIYGSVKPEAGRDTVISKGIAYQLEGSGAVDYNWSPAQYLSRSNIANPRAIIDQTQEFILSGIDRNGCRGYDTITLSVIEDYKIRPSNVITPEGNGENDKWVINNLENYKDNTVSVIDRWGRTVFTTKDYQNDWGATNENGTLLMDGTYYYVITFDSSDTVYKGAITVIRNN